MKARKSISVFILLAFSCFSFASMTDDQVKQGLSTMVEYLPIKLDNLTTINSIFLAPDKNIIYRYSFDFDQAIEAAAIAQNVSVDELIKSSLEKFGEVDRWIKVWGDQYIYPIIRRGNCSAPGPTEFMRSGFSLTHEIYDTHGNFLYQTRLTKEVCEKHLTRNGDN